MEKQTRMHHRRGRHLWPTADAARRFRSASCGRQPRSGPHRRASPITPDVVTLAAFSLLAASVSASSTGALQAMTAVAAIATTVFGYRLTAQPAEIGSRSRS